MLVSGRVVGITNQHYKSASSGFSQASPLSPHGSPKLVAGVFSSCTPPMSRPSERMRQCAVLKPRRPACYAESFTKAVVCCGKALCSQEYQKNLRTSCFRCGTFQSWQTILCQKWLGGQLLSVFFFFLADLQTHSAQHIGATLARARGARLGLFMMHPLEKMWVFPKIGGFYPQNGWWKSWFQTLWTNGWFGGWFSKTPYFWLVQHPCSFWTIQDFQHPLCSCQVSESVYAMGLGACFGGFDLEDPFLGAIGVLLVSGRVVILLMAEILHQLIGSLSHYLQGFVHPRWCRISAINSSLTSLSFFLCTVTFFGTRLKIDTLRGRSFFFIEQRLSVSLQKTNDLVNFPIKFLQIMNFVNAQLLSFWTLVYPPEVKHSPSKVTFPIGK